MKSTINHEIKKRNRKRIFEILLKNKTMSKQELVVELSLSLPTVTQNLTSLIHDGLVKESGRIGNTGGRNARVYSIVQDARVAIGLEIGYQYSVAVVVGLDGEVMHMHRMNEPFCAGEAFAQKLGGLVSLVILESGIIPEQILGVGIAVPGLVSDDASQILYGEILNITGMSIEEFSEFIHYPCSLSHDSNAAGLAELWCSGKEHHNAFYLMLGNNIGGAILLDNEVFQGANRRAGEIGHMTIVPDGKPCYCGQYGCLESYCSAEQLTRVANGSMEEFFKRLKEGGREQQHEWNNYLRYLSIAIHNLRMLFDCEIILGGHIGVYVKDYLEDLQMLVNSRNTFSENADYVKVCTYQTEPVATGAALPYIRNFLEHISQEPNNIES